GRERPGVQEPATHEGARAEIGIEVAALPERVVVAGGHERRLLHRVDLEQRDQPLLDPGVEIGARLELHDEAGAVPEALEHFADRLDALTPERPPEPPAAVQAL